MRTLEASTTAPVFYPGEVKKKAPPLNFPQHLAALRKERGLIQQALAERVGMHISQIRRYESGQSQPTLDAIRKLALALRVSADMLLFEKMNADPMRISSFSSRLCRAWTRGEESHLVCHREHYSTARSAEVVCAGSGEVRSRPITGALGKSSLA